MHQWRTPFNISILQCLNIKNMLITMKQLFIRLLTPVKTVMAIAMAVVFVIGLSAFKKDKVITIFTIGDSTMANKNINNGNTERGWGMMLPDCFSEDIRVDNHALNGYSSKSFIDNGKWQAVLDRIKPGDYVVIQFGHNDEKSNPKRHTDPGTTFDDNLRRFVRETREKGGIPILMNSVVRRKFYYESGEYLNHAKDKNVEDESLRNTTNTGETEKIVDGDTLVDTHGAYLLSPRNVAREMNVPFVDANKITHDLEQGLGPVESRNLHMWYLPGQNPAIPKGRKDNTHYNVHGARLVSTLLAEAIVKEVPALKKYLRHYDLVVARDGRGDFFDIQKAVDAAPIGEKTTILVCDGNWKKPTVEKGKNIRFVLRSGAKFVK